MNNSSDQEKTDWPLQSRFQKLYQPYGVRICPETLDDIDDMFDVFIEYIEADGEICVSIETREGQLKAYDGDWIMEDSEGHHYPIAHEELRKTYEPVDTDQ